MMRHPIDPQRVLSDIQAGMPPREDNSADQVVEQPVQPQQSAKPKFNLASLNWSLWAAAAITGAALVALLMSLKPDSSSHDDTMSDFMFDRWLRSSMFDDDDDYRPRKRSSSRSDNSGLSGFIPPIIINTPGQSPTILPGKKITDGGNND